MQLLGRLVVAFPDEGHAHVAERAREVGMLFPVHLAVDREGLARQLLRHRVVRSRVGEAGEGVERVGHLHMLGPQLPLLDGQSLALLFLRHLVDAQALVNAAHGCEHAGRVSATRARATTAAVTTAALCRFTNFCRR